jgi:pimeloyl-ACP methyl ester carboxylesterase
LHGFVGDARGTWGHQIDGLCDEFTVVAWDAPGAGRSSDPPESFRMPDYADCVASFVQALGIDRPHVAGLSFGGALALEFFRRHPMLPRSLVLAGAYAGWSGSLPADQVEERLQRSLKLSELPAEQFADAMLASMFSTSAPPEGVKAFAASVLAFHPVGFRAMTRSLAEADSRDVLASIDVPTLLLFGDKDVRAPLEIGEALHAAIRTSRLVVLPGVGHVSCVEAAERFTGEIRDFLRSV